MKTSSQYFERVDLWNSSMAIYGPFPILYHELYLGSDGVELSLKCDKQWIRVDGHISSYKNIM